MCSMESLSFQSHSSTCLKTLKAGKGCLGQPQCLNPLLGTEAVLRDSARQPAAGEDSANLIFSDSEEDQLRTESDSSVQISENFLEEEPDVVG